MMKDYDNYKQFDQPKIALPHKVWDKDKAYSAREYKIGVPFQDQNKKWRVIIDKIIMPINTCPYCRGHSTYHKWMQKHRDVVDNVWEVKRTKNGKYQVTHKFDYCYDCQTPFLIEAFLTMKSTRQPRPKTI
jgi:hypothetical protein